MSQNLFTQEEMQLLNSIFTKLAAFFGSAAVSLSQPETARLSPAKSRPHISAVRTKRKRTVPAPLTEMTFRKGCNILNGHISLLYASLLANDWISSDTTEDEFLSLFSATRNDCRIVWTGHYGKGTLVYLFCQLIAEGLIDLDSGFSLSRILEAHFVDTNGHHLTNLDHGDPFNNQAVPEVKDFIHSMKTVLGRRSSSVDTVSLNEFTDSSGYGDGYDPYDDSDLRHHNKHGNY